MFKLSVAEVVRSKGSPSVLTKVAAPIGQAL